MKTPMLSLVALLIVATPTGFVRGASGEVDATFNAGTSIDSGIITTAIQSDGKILVGGFFQTVYGLIQPNLARLNADGTADETFRVAVSGGSPAVATLLVQPDGKIVLGGGFTNVNGIARSGLARLHPDGSLDPTFLAQVDGGVGAMLRQNDGRLLIAGRFTNVSGLYRPCLARLTEDGFLDSTFLAGLAGPNYGPNTMAIQGDGRIVLAGGFSSVNGVARRMIARVNSDGSLDESFTPAIIEGFGVEALAIQANGKMLVGGFFFSVNGVESTGPARLNPDGTLDESFVPGVQASYSGIYGFFIQPDQKVLVHGVLRWAGIQGVVEGIARLHEDGSRDESFVAHAEAEDDIGVQSLALQSDGKIIIAGGSQWGVMPTYFRRLNADGSDDFGFGHGLAGPNTWVTDLARQADGKLLIAGGFWRVDGAPQFGIARLNVDGANDTNYQTILSGTDGGVSAVALQSDGKCLIGGGFKTVNGLACPGLARLNPDGAVDTTFQSGFTAPNSRISSLALQTDGRIVVGGRFISIGGISQTNLARLNTDGSLDTSFQPRLGVGSVNGVYTMALQADGKLIIGGYFNSVDGVARKNLARLDADGSLDQGFLNGMAGLNACPEVLVVQPDGKILVGGMFDQVNNVPRPGLAQLNPDGSLDHSFLNGAQFSGRCSVYTLALQPDGKILVGGYLPFVAATRHLARLNPDGSLDLTFAGPTVDPNGEVYSILIQPDSKIVIAGDFTRVGQTPRSYVARLQGDFEPPVIVSPPQSQTVETGSTVQFRVQAQGTSPLTYLWYFNSADCLGTTTNCTWHLPDVSLARAGNYSVIVTNLGGAATSAPVTLGVVQAVQRRLVPGLTLTGTVGSLLQLEHCAGLDSDSEWASLTTVPLDTSPQWYFDLTSPLPPQRFYRAWESGNSGVPAALELNFVPALTLTGAPGNAVQIDGINQFGPTDAWFTLDTVTLTNTSQLYFDVTAPGQPPRLYRLVPLP